MPRLRILFTAGSASSTELVQKWKDKVAYYNGYGPTENSVATSIWPVSSDPDAGSLISIGRPVPNHHVYIVDPYGHLLPVGVPGELCVAGAGLARGYLDRPELTSEKFVISRFSGERMYRTGDLARWLPDGRIEYLGRIDHQVKIRGYRIELGEVEAKILQVEAVQEAIVIAREDASGQNQLCAYFVGSRELAVSELRSALSAELPGYMVPSTFMQLEQMPLTPNGKIDRKALPAPDGSSQTGATYAAPRTPAEQALATIWQVVLGAKIVGIHDNFFELGGDSIKSIQVSSRLLQAGYKLEMKDLFAHPTIAELSPFLQLTGKVADQGEVTGIVGLTPIQHWFFEQNFAQPHHFNQAVMLYRAQGFDETALRQALTKITKHHDALRIVFSRTESGYEARSRAVNEGEAYSLETFDFCNDTNAAETVEIKANELQQGIDLSEGPLMKLGLFRCADGDHLLIVIHHLVVDGVSWRILFEDLETAYEQAAKGSTIRLPHKTDSFRTWAQTLLQEANSAGIEWERAYWRQVEQAEAETGSLPKDFICENTMTIAESSTVTVEWTEQDTERLLKQANRTYNTDVNDLLLTALGMAIHRWTGLEQVLVNLEGHGRENIHADVDITRTVGWFTSQYPVLLTTEASRPLSERIKRIKEDLRHIPRKGIGYGMLRYLSQQHETSELRSELEISFNYLGQFDQDLQDSSIRPSDYSTGISVSNNTVMKHVLNINGLITDGRLTLTIQYSSNAFRTETMEHLGGLLQASLQEIIAHCVTKEQPELTPSDVLLKGLTLEEFEQLNAHAGRTGELENVYALTPMQKGMLFHNLMEPHSGAYFEQATFDLEGSFDVETFGASLELLVQRHAVLRSNVYSEWKQEPVQIVFRKKRSEFYYEDLRGFSELERRAYVASFASKDKSRGFDLAMDALMRVSVLQTGDSSYSFIWSFHHIIMDGWCLSLVHNEVFSTYFALREQQQPELAAITPYSHYIEWLEKQDTEQAANYWSGYLAGYEQQTELPKGKPSDTVEHVQLGYAAEKLTCVLGKELSMKLNRTAKQHQLTINTMLQTAWGVLLQRYNNSRDVVFGSVVSGRPAEIPGVESMIGLFINTIPVRVQSNADESFAELLKRNQAQAIDSNAYDTYPLYEIQAQTAQKQDLISHIMIFENFPLDRQIESIGEGDGDAFEIVNAEMAEQTNYDFTITIMPGDETIIDFGYNTFVYSRDIVEQIQHHLVHLMEQIVRNPSVRIDDLVLVTPQEEAQILQGFNDTAADYPREKTICGLFEEQAERTPDRVAVRFEDEQLTYRELNERANRMARTLRAEGVQPDDKVGIMVERSLEMIVGIYAILKAGGAYVPIDPEYPEERISFILEDSGAKLLLTQQHLGDRMPAELNSKVIDLNDAALYAEDGSNLEPLAGPRDVAYVIYTSGSTGKPKGVMIEHHSVINRILWMHERYPIGEADVILQKTAFTFDVSVWELFWWAMVGSSVCMLAVGGEKSPERILATIERSGVTTMHFVPAMLHAFLDYAEQQPTRKLAEQLGSLRQVFASGEALPPQHVARFQRAVAWINRARLINLYGPTEATVDVSYFDCEPDMAYPVIPIGKPIHNTRLYIVKEGTQQLQPIGVAGELCIAGVGVARGYLNRPELTAEKFTDDPFADGQRMYRTGDLARWLPDGNIEYLGRIDHQVKIRGYRIELGEVESQLLNVEAVLEAVVVAREDENGQKLLCAYYVAEIDLTAGELRSCLSETLPSYMVPTYLVQLEQMPLSPNGKIDRKALPAPEGSIQAGMAYVAPRTEVEAMLAQIWQQILGLERVSVKDNFFDIGGHSLRATTMVARIHKELGVNMPLRNVFERSTIEELAVWITGVEQVDQVGYVAIPVAEESAYYPVSSAQKRLYILSQLEGGDISYNMPSVVRVGGPLDHSRAEAAFQRLIERHETLRTGFEMVNGEPVQRVHHNVEFAIEVVQANEAEAEQRMRDFVRAFDLRKPPLMRVELIELGDERHILQFDMHHIISDGASLGILIQEFVQLYGGEDLEPLSIQYKDYAVWQQAKSSHYEQQEKYWLTALAGELPVLDIPTDYPRPAVRSFEGARVGFELNPALTARLKRLADESDSTLFMVLLAAYTVHLANYSGQEDIIVGTPIAGRPQAELEPIIGMFVNTLALRNYPEEDKTFLAFLQEVKERALNAYENQEYPFEELVEKLSTVREMSRNPLFDTMIVLQNNENQELQVESLSFSHQEQEYNIAKFDLTLYVAEQADRVVCSMEYSTKLFKENTIDKLVADFAAILATVAETPNIRIGDIEQTDDSSLESVEYLF
ncbi:amino acid adenylation domain-containing protein [Paenibacillus sp. SI8]|uniref:amino acid adenylation domain-containing protein n=1 Tax=unclassified Paenibacillus TaxID=185978 RepID=UPI003465640C